MKETKCWLRISQTSARFVCGSVGSLTLSIQLRRSARIKICCNELKNAAAQCLCS